MDRGRFPGHRRDRLGQGCGRGYVLGGRNFRSVLSGEWEMGKGMLLVQHLD